MDESGDGVDVTRPLVFIGSSSEGLDLARCLQRELSRRDPARLCEPVLWNQGVFVPGGVQLDDLKAMIGRADFAVLIATPDDIVESRGISAGAVRDNVILELGMAIGLLGRERSYLVADQTSGRVKLPSDLDGITHIPYQSGTNPAAAVGPVATDIEDLIRGLGPRTPVVAGSDQKMGDLSSAEEPLMASTNVARSGGRHLGKERDQICLNAVNQGWRVKTNSESTLRLIDCHGRKFTLSLDEQSTAEDIRKFAGRLRAAGLRVHQSAHRLSRDPWSKLADLPRP